YLDYMHARYYSPTLGRFLSVDPTLDVQTALRVPQTWNRYAYGRNNPTRFTDPDGKVAIADGVVIGAVVGVVILTAYVQAPSVAVPGKTNGQVLVDSAIGGFQALGRAVGSLIPGRQPTSLPPPPPPTTPSRPSTPGTQATTGVNPAAPIQAVTVNTAQGTVHVPDGWTSRPADNGKGTVYQAPGVTGNKDMIRVMDPTKLQPTGYVVIYNGQGNRVLPDGKAAPDMPSSHLPIVK
ncbi:MAG TPA: RHS repeat-associated core domain-containing protein, partial [Thermoanaerobaculia bacterium]